MLVTIFADASYCHRTHAAGWGGWAKSQRATIAHSGPIKHEVNNASEAEMCAIVNAVHIAIKAGAAVAGDTLLIESDSLDALGALERRRPMKREPTKSKTQAQARRRWHRRLTIIEIFAKVTDGFELRFKHVKGHQGSKDARSHINSECDRHARRHMRTQQLRKRQKVYDAMAKEKPENADVQPQI